MSTYEKPSTTDYVAHFNQVISNYVEAIVEAIVEKDKERHARAAQSVDNLMREYAQATELLDFMRNRCWEQIEAAQHRGEDYAAVAATLAAEFPPIGKDLTDFAEDFTEEK